GTVRENLRLAFGRSDEGLVRGIYRHFAEAAVDLFFFGRLFDPSRLPDHFRLEGAGWEHYRRTAPAAAVFATGHFGNWELFGAAFRYLGIPLAVVARPPDQRLWARALERFRRHRGLEVLPKGQALPRALRTLRRGRCVAFLMDQAAGRHGIDLPFFGRPARTFTAPAALAHKLGLPLYAGCSTRLGPGIRYRLWAEPVPVQGDVAADTARVNRILEGYVRRCPEQWWWFHRRFKPPRRQRRGHRLSPSGIPLPP
ncbi:MAG: lysophospholipid acyltransferase family protein, partial [Planctomycetota bacterium]